MSTYSTFVDNAKKHLVKQWKNCIWNGTFRGRRHNHILATKDHVYKLLLCKDMRDREVCKSLFGGTLKFQSCAHHANSSQILCMNLFGPLLIRKDNNLALSQFIKGLGISLSGNIDRAQFEYKPDKKGDRTNFDFYVHTNKDEEVYFEIKYTEQSFGRPSSGSSKPKEVEFYEKLCCESFYLKDFCGKIRQKFLDGNFQIWRNIAHVKENGLQHSVFLFPARNTALCFPYEFCKPMSAHVKAVHLESIPQIAQEAFGRQLDLLKYYQAFNRHYFGF